MPAPNSLFAIVASTEPDKLGRKIHELFPSLNLTLGPGEWLLIAPSTMTTVEISKSLGITDGENGSALVVSVASYFGRLNVSTWEWITAKLGGGVNATQTS